MAIKCALCYHGLCEAKKVHFVVMDNVIAITCRICCAVYTDFKSKEKKEKEENKKRGTWLAIIYINKNCF